MKIKLLIVLGVILTAVFVFAKMPANVVLGHNKTKLAGVSAEQVQGTVWNGKAQNLKIKNINLEQVDWQMIPSSLADLGSLANINIKHGSSSLSAKVASLTNGTEFKDITGEIKITDLIEMAQKYKKLLIPVEAKGTILINMDNLAVDKNKRLTSANGKVEFKELEVGGQKLRGDYTADISTANKIVNAVVDSSSGSDLILSGKANIAPDGQYNFDGKLGSTEQTPKEILFMLKMIGITDTNKTVGFKRHGRFRY